MIKIQTEDNSGLGIDRFSIPVPLSRKNVKCLNDLWHWMTEALLEYLVSVVAIESWKTKTINNYMLWSHEGLVGKSKLFG